MPGNLVTGFRFQVSGVRCQVSGVRCQVSGVRCQDMENMENTNCRYLTPETWNLKP